MAETQGGQAWHEPVSGGGTSFGISVPLTDQPAAETVAPGVG